MEYQEDYGIEVLTLSYERPRLLDDTEYKESVRQRNETLEQYIEQLPEELRIRSDIIEFLTYGNLFAQEQFGVLQIEHMFEDQFCIQVTSSYILTGDRTKTTLQNLLSRSLNFIAKATHSSMTFTFSSNVP